MKALREKVRVKQFVFGLDKEESPELKVGINLESGILKSTQIAGLVLTLIKFELMRRSAYPRWKVFLHQVGLSLWDLIAYLNVLYDDASLIKDLKAYYFKSKSAEYSKVELLREANELYETLLEKINSARALSNFQVHSVRTVNEINE
ncbi:MAG: hypothetical protein KW804_01630 [Candidatus Doudnabacteria bacterium]|nr:hypothetical protein [Candidatus Doudnabacteria bacterium]